MWSEQGSTASKELRSCCHVGSYECERDRGISLPAPRRQRWKQHGSVLSVPWRRWSGDCSGTEGCRISVDMGGKKGSDIEVQGSKAQAFNLDVIVFGLARPTRVAAEAGACSCEGHS